MDLAGLYIYSYLVGMIPTAYIIGRLVKGIDIRQYGSGNVGGANVFYSVGRRWVVPLGVFELFVKGGSTVWVGRYVLDLDRSSYALMVAPLLVIVANNWSPLIKFSGGRGVAVAIGALLALAYKELILFTAVGLSGWTIFRSSGLWVYISLLLLPLWSLLLNEPLAITWFSLGIVGVVTVKRLTSNWAPLPEGVPKREVFLNRLLKDRDVAKRSQWMDRGPTEKGGRVG